MSPAEDWKVVSNGATKSIEVKEGSELMADKHWLHTFEQCPPISTYIYNMCAGNFEVIEDQNKQAETPMKIYLRASKLDNVDAEELFRIVNEGIKFYNVYTGVNFPF